MRALASVLILWLSLGVGVASAHGQQWTWQSLDYPGAYHTYVRGISGNRIVGSYSFGSGNKGFLIDGNTWKPLDYPGSDTCYIMGIDGNSIVGTYSLNNTNPAFLYDGTTWKTYSRLGANQTAFTGISGNSVIGETVAPDSCFLYDGSSWTTLAFGIDPHVNGIDGSNIVGYYQDIYCNYHGLVRRGGTWTTLDYPGASQTTLYAISGNNIVGKCTIGDTSHCFLYDGNAWTTFDYPGASSTLATGISGDKIVGFYMVGTHYHGFLLTTPEPATLSLLALGGLLLARRRRA